MSDMIVLKDVTKSFLSDRSIKGADGKAHRFTAVEPTSLSIQQGEIFGLMGYSGAGKSTLLRLINLLERPDSGQVIINDVDLTALSASDLRVARPFTIIKVLLNESRSGLVLSVTILCISLLSYSAAAGMIGGGGLGDLAIRYGYYRYQTEVMVFIVVMLSVMVVSIQAFGNWLATRLDKR
ncbi:ATP-binding cassette domain-containing protein [Psychrobacter sp. DM4]|uniref:ATP-binding cassette domain-containing protein n=1 Tax=Psychrobacter sp. DM4 TaxID=3440637 RepID=UPI003F500CCA